MIDYAPIVASIDWFDCDLRGLTSADIPPVWVVLSCDKDWRRRHTTGEPPRPKFCPFCGKPLPKLVKRAKPPKQISLIVDGGNSCDTCGERLSNCACATPEQAWEPA